MKLKFRYWPANTEILLIDYQNDSDEIESVVDSFYTSATHLYMYTARGNRTGFNAEEVFALLEDQLPAPNVAGAWAEHHDAMIRYRAKHPNVKVN